PARDGAGRRDRRRAPRRTLAGAQRRARRDRGSGSLAGWPDLRSDRGRVVAGRARDELASLRRQLGAGDERHRAGRRLSAREDGRVTAPVERPMICPPPGADVQLVALEAIDVATRGVVQTMSIGEAFYATPWQADRLVRDGSASAYT